MKNNYGDSEPDVNDEYENEIELSQIKRMPSTINVYDPSVQNNKMEEAVSSRSQKSIVSVNKIYFEPNNNSKNGINKNEISNEEKSINPNIKSSKKLDKSINKNISLNISNNHTNSNFLSPEKISEKKINKNYKYEKTALFSLKKEENLEMENAALFSLEKIEDFDDMILDIDKRLLVDEEEFDGLGNDDINNDDTYKTLLEDVEMLHPHTKSGKYF